MKRVISVLAVALGAVVMGGGNCGTGGSTGGCSRDSDCMAGEYCRSADGTCAVTGTCDVATDCDDQSLVHPACVGNWTCGGMMCAWHCGTPLPVAGQACGNGGECATGYTCTQYYGIAGPSGPLFSTCEHACTRSTDCSSGMTCVTIADGPGSVCRVR